MNAFTGGRAWWRNRAWLLGLLLVVAIGIAYQPIWNGGFLWDDDIHIRQNPMLSEPGGLRQIWFSPDSPQYYPLLFTSFRLEHALWGLNSAGYHWVNLLLHAVSAVLVWRVLRGLRMPGAWLAGMLFALHPVNVESAAWISQQKNTLAMVFFLMSVLWFLRSEEAASEQGGPGVAVSRPSVLGPQPSFYWLSLGAFVLALLSKTAVAPLPFVLLGLAWWRRGRVAWRDLLRSAPFFAAALVLGLMTLWFEHHRNEGVLVRADSFWVRLAGAGCAVWFYLYKTFLPLNLSLVYPRWHINPAKAVSYIPVVLVVVVFVLLWRYRRSWGRAGLLCAGYYVVMLLPVLGFANIGFMSYSLVADHWQYFSIISPIALVAAGVALMFGNGSRRREAVIETRAAASPQDSSLLTSAAPKKGVPQIRVQPSPLPIWSGRSLFTAALCAALLVALGGLTWRRSTLFANAETLWQATLAADPGCWIAHYNLAGLLVSKQGALDDALVHYRDALAVGPNDADTHNNIGNILRQKGEVQEAMTQYKQAIELRPDLAEPHCDLGAALLRLGRLDEGIAQFEAALEAFTRARRQPYGQAGFAQVRQILAKAHNDLGHVLFQQGQTQDALSHFQRALELRPDLAPACDSLAWVLATSPKAADRDGRRALTLARQAEQLTSSQNPWVLETLGAAYAEAGQFPEAVQSARRAEQLAQTVTNTALALRLRQQLELYQAGSPYRDTDYAGN